MNKDEPVYDTELDMAVHCGDWKTVVELLEKHGRLLDAKRVRNSLPYYQQAVREEWASLKMAFLEIPLFRWIGRMLDRLI